MIGYPASQEISMTIESREARINAVGNAARAAAVGDAIKNHRTAAVGVEHLADVGVSP